MSTESVIVTLLRLILALHPPAYRRQFGADVLDTARDSLRRAQAHGRLTTTRRALVELTDACVSLWLEWLDVAASLVTPGNLGLDVKLAFRSVTARPFVSAAIVTTLALGIGANAAIFSVVDAVLLRPVPIADPSSVVAIFNTSRPDNPHDGVGYPTYRDLAAAATSVTALAGFHDLDVHLVADGNPLQARIGVVTGRYFEVLGLTPAVGRLLHASDEGAPLASPYVVLSDALWRELYDRDPQVVGRTLRLGDTTFSIVGVAPAGFYGTDLSSRVKAWVPVTMMQGLSVGGMFSGRFSQTLLTTFRGFGWLSLIGRRNAEVSAAAVSAEFSTLLGAVWPRPAATAEPGPVRTMEAVPIADAATAGDRPGVVNFLALLMGLVGLVLLLACANVANLLLARAAERQRELGICAALGATRGRLTRRLLIESLLFGLAGGAAGLGLGVVMLRLLSAFMLPGGIRVDSLGLTFDLQFVAWGFGVAVLTTGLFGVWPAFRASRTAPHQAFTANVRSTSGAGPRPLLVGAQVAISLIILITASLFIRSLVAGLQTELGFSHDAVGAVTIETRLRGLTTSSTRRFYSDVVERLRHSPGIQTASVASHVPVSPLFTMGVRAADARGTTAPVARVGRNFITSGYFDTLGIEFLSGTDFPDTAPTGTSPRMVIVNAGAARSVWGTTDVVGRKLRDEFDVEGHLETVVIGVVADAKQSVLAGPAEPVVYNWLLGDVVSGKVQVLARGDDAAHARDVIRSVLSALDPAIPHVDPRLLSDHINVVLMPQRFGATLLALFGVVAITVAGLGMYAAFAYAVATRRAEIGIRLALGGTAGRVLQGIGRNILIAAAIGVLVGLAGGVGIAGAASRFLFGISRLDALAFLSGLGVVLIVIALVSAMALRRALAVNVVNALAGR